MEKHVQLADRSKSFRHKVYMKQKFTQFIDLIVNDLSMHTFLCFDLPSNQQPMHLV